MAEPLTINVQQAAKAAPVSYTVPGSAEVQPLSAFASFDGSAAASAFYPSLAFYSASGLLIGRVFPSSSVAAGGSADVTFAPFLSSTPSAAATGGMALLFDTLLTAPAANIDVTGISQSYINLLWITSLRTDEAALINSQADVVFNGKTGAGHLYEYWDSLGGKSSNTTGLPPFVLHGDLADPDHFAASVAVTPNYTRVSTDHMMMGWNSRMGQAGNNATWDTFLASVQYCAGADPIAITQVTITPAGGGNFVAGSRVSVYGL